MYKVPQRNLNRCAAKLATTDLRTAENRKAFLRDLHRPRRYTDRDVVYLSLNDMSRLNNFFRRPDSDSRSTEGASSFFKDEAFVRQVITSKASDGFVFDNVEPQRALGYAESPDPPVGRIQVQDDGDEGDEAQCRVRPRPGEDGDEEGDDDDAREEKRPAKRSKTDTPTKRSVNSSPSAL